MVDKIDNLDEVIDKIAEKVLEKLRGVQGGGRPSGDCKTDCNSCGQCVTKNSKAVSNIVDSGAHRISSNAGLGNVDHKLAHMIDHTILKPEATHEELIKVCKEARQYGFATVCVNSTNIPLVARELKGSTVKPIAVVGFPLGAASTQSKVYESKEAIKNGAEEIDMVINIGAMKSKDYRLVYDDILKIVEASKPYKVKVILETSNLNNDEKVIACALSKAAGAAFVKTSTGFGKGGATVEDITLMRKIVGDDMEVKASGGIRTKEDAEKMVQAGADRIGASASVGIVTGQKAKTGTY